MGDAGEEKPEVKEGGEHINVKVKAQDGNEIFFKIKKSTPFRKLMDAYCKRQGTDENGILFLVDGKRLRPEQTPDHFNPRRSSRYPSW
jgi:hypothetical protein